MPDRPPLDLLIKNARLVRPRHDAVETRDLGIADGRFARVEPVIDATEAREVFDARGQLAFPGVVDAHTHVGIYAPLAEDAVSESRAAVSGGVTTVLTYFRTGQYYLNRGGPYADCCPQGLARPVLVRLCLSPGPDREPAHRRDGVAGHRAGRALVQDLHVLRRPRAARPGGPRGPATLPDGGGRRELRLRPLRVHHARGDADPADPPPPGPSRDGEPALRGGRHPQRLHAAGRARRLPRRPAGLQRGAATARGRARGVDRRLPRPRDRVRGHQPPASLLPQGGGGRGRAAPGVPASGRAPRGHGRPPPARLR